jgi:SAM-dependent methyltransferase
MDLIRLNLGCGTDIDPEAVNADICALPGVGVVHDLDVAPWPWKDGSVAYIKASHLFEHVQEPVLFMTEAWRVLGGDGILDIRVPWWNHPNAFTDPTHRRFCTEHTFVYWVPGQALHAAYGAAMGAGDGGARYAYEKVSLNGPEHEELQAILRKLGD